MSESKTTKWQPSPRQEAAHEHALRALHFRYDGLAFKSVGEKLGVSASRARQLCVYAEGVLRWRRRMEAA